MGEERDWMYESDEVLETIRRYEDMMKKKARYFFDVHEFEEIIDYYMDINDFSKAVFAAEYGYRMHPSSTAIQLKIAHLLIDKGKMAESIGILDRLEKLEESNYEVYILKGSAYNAMGKLSEAQRHFDKAISLTIDDNRDEVLYNIGMSFEHLNHFNTAIKYFLQAYQVNPENPSVLYDLAYCYERVNQPEKSIQFYDKYLDEDPFCENAWFNIGTIYNKVLNDDKALEAYDFAIAINPDYSSAYYNKANILSNLERYDLALIEYLEFLRIEPEHIMAHCYIGECYEKTQQYDQALAYFEKALTYDPECADALFGKGVVMMHLERYSESEELIKHALEINEDNTEYLYALGLVYMRQENYNEAVREFKQVVELEPLDYEAWLNYSEMLYDLGRTAEAIEILHRACDYNFNNAFINIRLASYLFVSNDMRQGYLFLDRALACNTTCVNELYEYFPEASNDKFIKAILEKHLNQNPE
ncbi:MAG: tetratricopeptide repeat protein [Bacteroidota bacterium]|nr:tetratricopeptide repeat protein [Bacteroidota bacterium]